MADADDQRVIGAYHVFRNGCAEPPSAWEDLPDWTRDAMRVAYLQGTLDEPPKLGSAESIWSRFVRRCEEIEEEPELAGDDASYHFQRGRRSAAKSIRRSVEHPKYAR